ncbi:PE-PGRS family protein [Streptomyces sp. NPDC052052]|uniref:PE-PGRS family protein n=1 Tax=Streptomyces sp. NPDC052052 TaxID=3154756 RepID=UPI003426957E
MEDLDGDDGPQPWAEWPSYLLDEGWRTVVVPADLPGLSAELNCQWEQLARSHKLFDEAGTFLIDILTAPGSGVSGRWTRVRLTDRWDLAGVLGERPAQPDFVALSTDGTILIRVATKEDEVRLLILDRIGERRQAATRTATAQEAQKEQVAAWEGFFQGDEPSPQVRRAWADGLALNLSTPIDQLTGLLGLSDFAAARSVSRSVVEAAMVHPDFTVRCVLAESGALMTPGQWSRMILGEQDERRRRSLTLSAADKRTHLTDTAYDRLASDPSERIREAAAELTGLPVHLLTALAADPHPAVRRSACKAAWPHLDWEARRDLLADPSGSVRVVALLRHHQDHPMPRAVFEEENLEVRALATCRLERAFAEHLIGDNDPARRLALADNHWLQPDLVDLLSRDTEAGVRSVVALRADLAEEQRAAIDFVFDPRRHTPALGWVAELHDNPQALRRLAASSHPLVRRSVARAHRLPPDVVELLSRDEDRVVQLFLAESCDDAPGEMLLRVWKWWTGSLTNPGRPRNHPRFPRRGVLRFADDPDPRMRQLALDDPQSTPELVDRFSQDDDDTVRLRAATDLRLGPESAVRLLDDPHPSVRWRAAGHPRLPTETLISALRNPDTAEAAAKNPALPKTVITRMIHWLRKPPSAALNR